jgi:hypothetical protein
MVRAWASPIRAHVALPADICLKAANALGFTILQSIMLRADEEIE